jgi:hypothetical protein
VERDERERLERLERQVAVLEATVVRRNGPIVDELRSVGRDLRDFKSETASREEVRTELARQTRELKHSREERFSRREKLAGTLFAAALLALNLLQVVHHP